MYQIKTNWLRYSWPQRTSMDYYKVIYICNGVVRCFIFFCITKLKKMSNLIFRLWFLVKSNLYWKTFQMKYNMTMFRKVFPTYQLSHLEWYLIFPAFRTHSVLLKIGQYSKSNLMIHNLSMFGKITFVVTVDYYIISI